MSASPFPAGAPFTTAGILNTVIQILGHIAFIFFFAEYYKEVRAMRPCLLHLDHERRKLEEKLSILEDHVEGTTKQFDEMDRCILAIDSRTARKVAALEIKTAGSLDVLNGGMEAVVVMLENVSERVDARLEEQKEVIEGQAGRIDDLRKMIGGKATKEAMETASGNRQQD